MFATLVLPEGSGVPFATTPRKSLNPIVFLFKDRTQILRVQSCRRSIPAIVLREQRAPVPIELKTRWDSPPDLGLVVERH